LPGGYGCALSALSASRIDATDRVRTQPANNQRAAAGTDVCEIGEREGSADATIRRERPNAIDRLLDEHPLIRAVAFNGTGARRLYDRHFPRRTDLTYLALPSTSPAHARIDFVGKLARWMALREAGDDGLAVVVTIAGPFLTRMLAVVC